MSNNEVRIVKRDNKQDLSKVEFSLNEIKINIDPRILKKLNQKQNRNHR
jgi:hypothetical protein